MKTTIICSLILSSVLVTGCEDEHRQAPDSNASYSNINLTAEQVAEKMLNEATSVGEGTVWLCMEPPTGDVIYPTTVMLKRMVQVLTGAMLLMSP